MQLNAVCVLVSRQIGNVGLLDGGGKMTEGGQERGQEKACGRPAALNESDW